MAAAHYDRSGTRDSTPEPGNSDAPACQFLTTPPAGKSARDTRRRIPTHGRKGDAATGDFRATMTETAEQTSATAAPATNGDGAPRTAPGAPAAPAAPAVRRRAPRATELAILDALRAVVDPEIGMNVVELALIKQILLGENETEIKMILTTPFCPYAGSMIPQVKEQAESVVEHPVKVTLLAERWDPRDAGLMW